MIHGKSHGVEDTREIPKESGKNGTPGKVINGKAGKNGKLSVSNGANHGKAETQ